MAKLEKNLNLEMKLFVDTRSGNVVFAEADKPMVDLLFSLLTLRVGSVIRLLARTRRDIGGGITKLHTSLDAMPPRYVEEKAKDSVLRPPPEQCALVEGEEGDGAKKGEIMYYCRSCDDHITADNAVACPRGCSKSYWRAITLVAADGGQPGKGYVKDVLLFLVTDDLTVIPSSAAACLLLLRRWGISDVGDLEEKVVKVTAEEAVALLKASFQSTTVLSDVFLSDEETASIGQVEEHIAPAAPVVLAPVGLGGRHPAAPGPQAPVIGVGRAPPAGYRPRKRAPLGLGFMQ